MKAFIAVLCGVIAFAVFSLTQIEAKAEKVETTEVSVKLDNMNSESFTGTFRDQKRNQAESWD